MKARHRDFYLVMAGQAVCVGVGLWMQHRMTDYAIRTRAREAFWVKLEHVVTGDARRATPAGGVAAMEWDKLRCRAAALEQHLEGARCHVVVTDEQWRVVWPEPGQAGDSAAPWRAGSVLSWAPAPGPEPSGAGPQRGTLHTPDGEYLAVALPTREGGRAVALASSTAADELVAGYRWELWPISLATFLWTMALLSLTVYLVHARHQDALREQRAQSETGVLRQTQTLIRTRDAMIYALAKLAGSRDYETGAHLERMSDYCAVLATELGRQPRYAKEVTPTFVRLIGLSAVLHDIGKVAIEDRILRKPGKLTPEERKAMERHAAIGSDCLADVAVRMGNSTFIQMARQIALAHHERWDGSGYPHGIRGEQIPLAARIVAIADVYDALRTPRVYKQALPHDECLAIMTEATGTHFDPDIFAIWLPLAPQFDQIAQRYAEQEQREAASRFVAEPAPAAAQGPLSPAADNGPGDDAQEPAREAGLEVTP